MTLPPRLLSGTLTSVSGRLLGTLLSILTISIVTRSLTAAAGVGAYGSYAIVFAVLGVVAVVADGGLYLTFTKRASHADQSGEAGLLRAVLSLRVISLLLTVLVVGVAVTFLPYPSSVQQGIRLGMLGIGSQLITQLLLGVFQKRLRMFIPAAAEVAGRAVTLLAAFLFALQGGGILAFVLAFVLGALVTLLWAALGVLRFLPLPLFRVNGPAPVRPRELIQESWPLGLMLICWLIVFRIDSILLSLLRPPADLGWYALPYKVLESLLFFPAMIGGLLFPTLSRTVVEDRRAFAGTLAAATRLFLLLAIPVVATLFVSAPVILQLLGGPWFTPSIPVLQILAFALGALFFGNLFGNGAIALGAQRSLLQVAAGLALGNIAVNLLVIPRYSYLGAAWTTLGTEVLSAVLAAVLVLRRVSVRLWSREHWHLVSAGGTLVLVTLLPLSSSLRLLLGLLAYAGVLWLLGVLTPTHLRALFQAQRVAAPSSGEISP